jgi:hypothetical protein
VTFTAGATGGTGTYEYRFFVKGPADTVATLVQAYSTTNTFQWTTPAPAGTYSIGVQVRSQGSPVGFEAQKWITYQVAPAPATGATLSASPASPQTPGTIVTFTAGGIGGGGTYDYQFYLKGPADTAATLVQAYSTASTYQWTTPTTTGTYSVGVQVRSLGSTGPFQAQKWMTYTVQ